MRGILACTLVGGALLACAPEPRTAASAPAPPAASTTDPPRPAPPRMSQASPTQKRDVAGVSFAYEAHGEGAPIVFLHGMPTDRRSMVPRYEPVFGAAAGWKRVYVDLPGMGETRASASITSLDQYYDAVIAFIDAEAGGQKVTLVGNSWGAPIVLAYARKHPDRTAGIALIAPQLDDPSPPPAQVLVKEPGVYDGEPPPLVEMLGQAATVHTRVVRDTIKQNVAPGARSADFPFLGRVRNARLSYADELRRLRFEGPALVLAGKQDAMVGYARARELAEGMPRATFGLLDRAGHALPIEQGDLFHAHVREWLSRVREGLGGRYD